MTEPRTVGASGGVLPGGVVAVPVEVAALLIRLPGFTALRTNSRGTAVYAPLLALYQAGLQIGVPGNGTLAADVASAVPSWLSTGQTAEILGVTPRAVVKLLNAGSLAGRRCGGRWQVNRHDVERRLARRR